MDLVEQVELMDLAEQVVLMVSPQVKYITSMKVKIQMFQVIKY